MRKTIKVVVLSILAIAGWFAYDFVADRAPPHRFVVKLDEQARSVSLTLGNSNGDVTTAMDGGPTKFTGSQDIGDASGAIRVEWPDGSSTECIVGYITNGEREPHVVAIDDRKCPKIRSHV